VFATKDFLCQIIRILLAVSPVIKHVLRALVQARMVATNAMSRIIISLIKHRDSAHSVAIMDFILKSVLRHANHAILHVKAALTGPKLLAILV
jgi:hypothetical protein